MVAPSPAESWLIIFYPADDSSISFSVEISSSAIIYLFLKRASYFRTAFNRTCAPSALQSANFKNVYVTILLCWYTRSDYVKSHLYSARKSLPLELAYSFQHCTVRSLKFTEAHLSCPAALSISRHISLPAYSSPAARTHESAVLSNLTAGHSHVCSN